MKTAPAKIPEWPKIIRNGPVILKIYRVENKGRKSFTLLYLNFRLTLSVPDDMGRWDCPAACRLQDSGADEFVSYRVAEAQDVPKVALEAGNSPQIIFQHHRELMQPKEAKTWFAIVPTSLS